MEQWIPLDVEMLWNIYTWTELRSKMNTHGHSKVMIQIHMDITNSTMDSQEQKWINMDTTYSEMETSEYICAVKMYWVQK